VTSQPMPGRSSGTLSAATTAAPQTAPTVAAEAGRPGPGQRSPQTEIAGHGPCNGATLAGPQLGAATGCAPGVATATRAGPDGSLWADPAGAAATGADAVGPAGAAATGAGSVGPAGVAATGAGSVGPAGVAATGAGSVGPAGVAATGAGSGGALDGSGGVDWWGTVISRKVRRAAAAAGRGCGNPVGRRDRPARRPRSCRCAAGRPSARSPGRAPSPRRPPAPRG
jgi:hypothetical protein